MSDCVAVSGFIARRPVDSDFAVLAQMRRDSRLQNETLYVPEDTADAAIRAWMTGAGSCVRVVADAEDQAIGFAEVRPVPDARKAHGRVAILVDRRGQGAGTAALTAVIDVATELGMASLLAEMAPDNSAARGLHLRHGFREVGVLDCHFRDTSGLWRDVLVMQRPLGLSSGGRP